MNDHGYSRTVCPACRDTGWCPMPTDERGAPWSGACLCDKGRNLAMARSWPVKRDPKSITGPPVVIAEVPREAWLAALARGRKRAELGSPADLEEMQQAIAAFKARFKARSIRPAG